jgi:hypothetical protein
MANFEIGHHIYVIVIDRSPVVVHIIVDVFIVEGVAYDRNKRYIACYTNTYRKGRCSQSIVSIV